MTLDELIARYRDEAQDEVAPLFCSDELLTSYANEGQTEACRRGQLLRDSTSTLCHIPYAANAVSIEVDPLIVTVLRATVAGYQVFPLDAGEMDCLYPGWQNDTATARPSNLVSGLDSGRLNLWPRPQQAGQVVLTVLRMPRPMRKGEECPEIRPETHPALVDWMLYRAFGRLDADRFEPTKAAEALARFEAEFGKKASGRNEQWAREGSSVRPDPIA